MTITYAYVTPSDSEGTQYINKFDDGLGTVTTFPTVSDNLDYAEFLSSGATAEEYVAPEPPAPPPPAEKLAASGLTVDELKELLGL